MAELILALDQPDLARALSLYRRVADVVRWAKVGLGLYTACGPEAVARLAEEGAAVFLDLKLHDIPHQVALAAAAARRAGAAMLTVHASGGREMVAAAKEAAPDLLVVAVTLLTSLDGRAVAELFGADGSEEAAASALSLRLLRVARAGGADGAVAAVAGLERLRAEAPPPFRLVTPGIRRPGDRRADQARPGTPGAAVLAGSDFLVVGRPIAEAGDPRAAAEEILQEMAEAERRKGTGHGRSG